MDLLPRGFSSPRCREPRAGVRGWAELLRTPTPRGLGAQGEAPHLLLCVCGPESDMWSETLQA